MSRFPPSWLEVTLGELVRFEYGKALPERDRSGSGFPVYGSNGVVGRHREAIVPGEALVVGRKGSIGEVHHATEPSWPIDTTYYVQSSCGMPPRFLYYLLRTLRLDLLDRATAVPGLNREDAYAVTLGLPPLEEQTRIANKLDTLFTRVDACLERLDRLRAILDRLRQAVLVAATNGELTREWRDERGVARAGWRSVTFQDVCSEITVGFVGKMADQYLSSGVPFLRSQNVRPFKFDPRELRFISPEFHRSIAKSTLRPGDVVVVRTGAPGQCCVVPNELSEANCSDLVIVRPGPELDPEFAVVFINSETSQAFVKAEQVGVAQSHFNVGSMKRSPIDLPSLPEQREIARRVREIFDLAASLDERVRAARQSAAGLNSGVLAKAFRGELVPQDPTDEPATSLLASLRARHEEAPRTGRSRKANRP